MRNLTTHTPPPKNTKLKKIVKRFVRLVFWLSATLIGFHHIEQACAKAMAVPVDQSALHEGLMMVMDQDNALSAGTAFVAGLTVLQTSAGAFLGYFAEYPGAAAIVLYGTFETACHLRKGARLIKLFRRCLGQRKRMIRGQQSSDLAADNGER